jgi:hypothetical protein
MYDEWTKIETPFKFQKKKPSVNNKSCVKILGALNKKKPTEIT